MPERASLRAWARLRAWGRLHPVVFDGALAVVLALLGVASLWFQPGDWAPSEPFREPDALGIALTLASCLPLAWRRRRPLAVFGTVLTVCTLLDWGSYATGSGSPAPVVALYTVATCCGRRRSGGALLVALAAVALAFPLGPAYAELGLLDLVAGGAVAFAAWAFGRSVRLRRAYVGELEVRARRLEEAREADLRAVVAEERGRIARELHDVVAHSLSVMIVQATAAQRTLDRAPARSREAMHAVEETGRGALQEMRRVVGVLREPPEAVATDGPGTLAPQPGRRDLTRLVDQFREAGLSVDLRVQGPEPPLPAGVDLTVYRLVQEALTNTLKHAGPTGAVVVLTYGNAELLVQVTDEGRGAAAGLGAGTRPGHGLLGMQERVGLYGGTVRAGPRRGGGFEVVARLPIEPADLPARVREPA